MINKEIEESGQDGPTDIQSVPSTLAERGALSTAAEPGLFSDMPFPDRPLLKPENKSE